MTGWKLPQPSNDKIPGDGPYVDAPDRINFAPGTSIPRNFVYWGFPKRDACTVSPPERPFSLRLLPSRHSITGPGIPGESVDETAITFISRRQSHTYFTYSVDVSFGPKEEGEEVGVTVFLTQYQHIDLGIVLLPDSGKLVPHLRFQTTMMDDLNTQAPNVTVPETVVKAIPHSSSKTRARLQIQAANDTQYILSAAILGLDDFEFHQHADAVLVSGGTGRFTGKLLSAQEPG